MATPVLPTTFTVSDSDFKAICGIVHELAGIHLHEGKRELVTSRLAKRIRALGLPSLGDYLTYVREQETQDELITMLDTLTTNLTRFWRESEHFNYLVNVLVPQWSARQPRGAGRLRVWSAGCSTGEEPYGLAMLLLSHFQKQGGVDIRILATDLSTKVLNIAHEGLYTADRVEDVPVEIRRRYFDVEKRNDQSFYRVGQEAKRIVAFDRLNLMEPWPMKGPFDFIFCRNVMIYFDKPTQKRLVDRFHSLLTPKGVLFVGHSESLTGIDHNFKYLRPTVYGKL